MNAKRVNKWQYRTSCGEADCTKHKKGTLYHGQLVEKILNDITDVYEWAIVKPCDNEITEDNLKGRRIKPSQLKPTRHLPMPDTISPNESDSLIVDIDNWCSNDSRLNEYLKTHDSISIRKKLVDNGKRRQGVFTFYKDRKDCMWTLTIEDYEPTIEIGEKEND